MILRDSIDPDLIPQNSEAVAGYGDGIYLWSSAGWDRFPGATPRLVIVVSAADAGDVLDVERGDATPADVPGWIDRFARVGRRRPTVYCDRSTIAAVRQAADGRPFDWWAATLDGTTDVPGAVAVQFRDVGPYDESLVLDQGWLRRSMDTFIFNVPGGLALHLPSGLVETFYDDPDRAAIQDGLGIPSIQVTDALSAQLLATDKAIRAALDARITLAGTLPVSGEVKLG